MVLMVLEVILVFLGLAGVESAFRLNAGAVNTGPNIKLQRARFRTPEELQTRDLVENDRLDVLYLPIRVLDLEN